MEPYAGAELGDYVVERKVGEGSFGAVWSGLHRDTKERVALKVLLPAAAANHEQVSRFHREAELLELVRSPNVARMVEFLVDDQFGVVLVMEFIDGELMSEHLHAGILGVDETLDLGTQILDGVADLHEVGIIHRDLKPNNIMLCKNADGSRRVVIFDLGLSRLVRDTRSDESTRSLTGSHVALGTLECMAPEQILNARDVTVRSDVYSVGSILYRAMTGYYPFASEDERDLARRKLTVETPEIVVVSTDALAEGMRAIITKATRRRPAQRYETARSMRNDFVALRELAKTRASAVPAKNAPPRAANVAPDAYPDVTERSARARMPTLILEDRQPKSSRRELAVAILVGFSVFFGLVGLAFAWRALHR
jgi:serine/threonine-protein kinase